MNIQHHDSRLEIKDLSSSGVFSGYGSVYDRMDEGGDIVAGGAFTDSLETWGAKGLLPALLWQHQPAEPIGAYTRMSEDAHGLHVEAQLAMKTQRGAEAYDLLKMKAISGLSIGFLTREDSMDRKTGVRTIKKADLWEVSLVTFPMMDLARVDTVKSIPDFSTIADLEKYLRDTGGYSRTVVMTMLAKAKRLFLQRDTGANGPSTEQAIVRALQARAASMATKADSEGAGDPTPEEADDSCSLPGGCCMPGECCNSMGKCVASAIGATGP